MVFTSVPVEISIVAAACRQPWVGWTLAGILARRRNWRSRGVRVMGSMGTPAIPGNKNIGSREYSAPQASALSSTRALCARSSSSTTAAGMPRVRYELLVLATSRTTALPFTWVTVRRTSSVAWSRSTVSRPRPSNSERRRPSCTALLGLCGLLLSPTSHAQDVSRSFLCENFKGTWFGAPEWKAEADGMSGQQVLLNYNGTNSNVKWYRGGKVYYENSGVGIAMDNGFAIITMLDEQIETYVFNSGTVELLFSATRSGSSMLPNSIKTQRATCNAAGSMLR